MSGHAPGEKPGSEVEGGPSSSVSTRPGTGAVAAPSPTWRTLGLWLLVLAQIAIPASYYLVRDDRDDERFAWRMFSAVRVKKCRVSLADVRPDERRVPVDLKRTFHSAWVHALERRRGRVIEAALRRRCEGPEVAEAILERRCQDAARRPLAPEVARMGCRDERLVMDHAP